MRQRLSYNEVRLRMCGAKTRYNSQADADRYIGNLPLQTRQALNSYQCKFCGGYWHVGHIKKQDPLEAFR